MALHLWGPHNVGTDNINDNTGIPREQRAACTQCQQYPALNSSTIPQKEEWCLALDGATSTDLKRVSPLSSRVQFLTIWSLIVGHVGGLGPMSWSLSPKIPWVLAIALGCWVSNTTIDNSLPEWQRELGALLEKGVVEPVQNPDAPKSFYSSFFPSG